MEFWSDDELLYTLPDADGRPHKVGHIPLADVMLYCLSHCCSFDGLSHRVPQVMLHRVAKSGPDTCLLEERDPQWFLDVGRSKDWQYLTLTSTSKTASEVRRSPLFNKQSSGRAYPAINIMQSLHNIYKRIAAAAVQVHLLGAHQPWDGELLCMETRQAGLEYFVEHHSGQLFILAAAGSQEYALYTADAQQPRRRCGHPPGWLAESAHDEPLPGLFANKALTRPDMLPGQALGSSPATQARRDYRGHGHFLRCHCPLRAARWDAACVHLALLPWCALSLQPYHHANTGTTALCTLAVLQIIVYVSEGSPPCWADAGRPCVEQLHTVHLPAAAATELTPGANPDFHATFLTIKTSSPIGPETAWRIDLHPPHAVAPAPQPLGAQQDSNHNHNSAELVCMQTRAVAADGASIPITLAHRQGTPLDGSRPLLLTAYGAYGMCADAGFRPERLSLMERG